MLKCALSRWIVPVCCWIRPELEREMYRLVLPSCQPRGMRKEKREGAWLALPFYGARGGMPVQDGMGRSHSMKCMISIFQWLNNSRTK